MGLDYVVLSFFNFFHQEMRSDNNTASSDPNSLPKHSKMNFLRQEVGSDGVVLSLLNFLHQEVGSDGVVLSLLNFLRQEVGSDDVVLSLLNFFHQEVRSEHYII